MLALEFLPILSALDELKVTLHYGFLYIREHFFYKLQSSLVAVTNCNMKLLLFWTFSQSVSQQQQQQQQPAATRLQRASEPPWHLLDVGAGQMRLNSSPQKRNGRMAVSRAGSTGRAKVSIPRQAVA